MSRSTIGERVGSLCWLHEGGDRVSRFTCAKCRLVVVLDRRVEELPGDSVPVDGADVDRRLEGWVIVSPEPGENGLLDGSEYGGFCGSCGCADEG